MKIEPQSQLNPPAATSKTYTGGSLDGERLREAIGSARPVEGLRNEPMTIASTSIHSLVIAIPLIATAYLCFVFCMAFAGGEASLVLAVVVFISSMFLGLFTGCGAYAQRVDPARIKAAGFREFLCGDVNIETGRIGGREVLVQIAVMPVALAVGGTLISAVAMWARS
jgi:hypothetical protein